MRNGLLGQEEPLGGEEARRLYRQISKVKFEHPEELARIDFFMRETTFVGATAKGNVLPSQGHPQPILIGTWAHGPNSNIYVRMGVERPTSTLIVQDEHPYGAWGFDVRTDIKGADGGFVYTEQVGGGGTSLRAITRSLPHIERIVQAIQGYESVHRSRVDPDAE